LILFVLIQHDVILDLSRSSYRRNRDEVGVSDCEGCSIDQYQIEGPEWLGM